MKKISIIVFLSLFIFSANAQKMEKIRGSKIVTIEQKEIGNFTALEVENGLEVFLVKGSSPAVEVEADDNLHETIEASVLGGILYIRVNKNITSAKKVSIRVVYTDELKRIAVKDKATITALADLQLDTVEIKAIEQSKLFLNATVNEFTLSLSDKTRTELNLKSKNAKIDLDKTSQLKALIASNNLNIDLYNKSNAVIEGDAENSRIRIDNNATFESKNFTVKNTKLTTIDAAKASINSVIQANIEASGKSEVYIYGEGKVVLDKFSDNAVIMKKNNK
jgi:hypothetical protein